jgi:glycine dehydrogenase subunit 1
MSYLYATEHDRQRMLESIGVDSIEALLAAQIPEAARLNRSLSIPPGLTEIELERRMRQLAGRNVGVERAVCFLGAGAYDHFIPAVVDALASRGEYYTSYTPYQAEVSQGNLQVMFEYETLLCQLTQLDVSNASLYDGGTACVEAVLMALAATQRRRVVVSEGVHPEYRDILRTYLKDLDAELIEVPLVDGRSPVDHLRGFVDPQTACLVVAHPNFLGQLEAVEQLSQLAHENGALLVQVFDPISLGLLKSPGELGVDIAVGEGQSLGNPLAYGGPYLGLMTCRHELIRRLPGRIAGQTLDREGRRCWVLTLQTREQHIRREKATSNICTNQGLLALRAAIYLSLLGPQGLRETAEHCLQKTAYARSQLARVDRLEVLHPLQPVFREFVVRDRAGDVPGLLAEAAEEGILAGVPIGRWYPEYRDCLLIAVTEKRTREQIDALVGCWQQSAVAVGG